MHMGTAVDAKVQVLSASKSIRDGWLLGHETCRLNMGAADVLVAMCTFAQAVGGRFSIARVAPQVPRDRRCSKAGAACAAGSLTAAERSVLNSR